MLDARLYEAAHMVSSLLADRQIEVGQAETSPNAIPLQSESSFSRQLSCQIWTLDGGIVGQSGGAPDVQLTDRVSEGYSQSVVNGEPWRVYTLINKELGVRVMVGDSLGVRHRLVWDVLEGLLLPGALALPILGAILWLSVAKGMAPLERLAFALRGRAPDDLSAIPDGVSPPEIESVRQALNTLFSRVAAARNIERDFTTYAAHELKTPLAGLRTQTQILRLSDDPKIRKNALDALERSVDRTDRMVRQLLELSFVEKSELAFEDTDLHQLAIELVTDLLPFAKEKSVTLETQRSAENLVRSTNPFLFETALRNIIENAIHASPECGEVLVVLEGNAVSVKDQGPGMSDEELEMMNTRFKRGHEGSPNGSGLGLTIVASAMERLDGRVVFERMKNGGQCVSLHLINGVV